jgi:hypothetical protein
MVMPMVAGQPPKGFPLNLEPTRDLAPNQAGASSADRVDRMTQAVFGHDVKFHEVTGEPLQQGSGCLPPDEQALTIHLPLIAKRDGMAAAQAMHAKLTKPPAHVIADAVAEAQGKIKN